MVVRLRLARHAAQPKRAEDRPGYNGEVIRSGIVAKPVLEKRMEWNEDRIKYWLNTGAQPTKSVFRLLYRAGLIPPEKLELFKGLYRPAAAAAPSASPQEGDAAAKAE
ncbi:37S ribosomal protein S16, mitochondrial [Malassezia japonica]|uniref:37S ribosomal protein S16, mitochondrial n=1 Tax=Malassezia japonica TaxID=223818 RepID=A0AAF0F0D2_9BASI|nr:37S ribosomal protein S16, mitochondrial [Malassezia japonica]WFD38420.1 37S ribosomal protein S16, mitochondrial [Malassezia japonica]